MSITERLWNDQELQNIAGTIQSLRRIRTAATWTENPIVVRVKNLLGVQIEDRSQAALSDAERVALSAANVLAGKLTSTLVGTEHEEWNDTLSDTARRYGKTGESTFARTTNLDVGLSRLDILKSLSVDPDHMLVWELTKANNLGAKSVDQLLAGKIGVFSPLSGDYLLANILRSYLERTRGKTYPLAPVASNSNLSRSVLPRKDGKLPFSEQKEIGIFLDVVRSGKTGATVYTTLKESYPTHVVHEPPKRFVRFQPSRKLLDARKQLQQKKLLPEEKV